MPTNYRVTMLFSYSKSSPPCGFSEQWCRQLPSSPGSSGNISTIQQWATDLVDVRLSCLSQDWTIIGTRIAELTVATGEDGCYLKAKEVGVVTCPNVRAGRLGPTDTPWTAVYIKIGAPSAPRRQQMRGVPDTLWANGEFVRDQAVTIFQRFMNYVAPPAPTANQAWKLYFKSEGSDCATKFAAEQYKSWCIQRASSRRIGRPFGLLVGRSSRKTVEPTPTP